MDELVKYLQKKGCSKSSIESYQRTSENFINWAESRNMDTEFITYNELIDYVAYLKKRNLSQRTIQSYMIGVTHYFEGLVQAEIIQQNPARYLEIKANQTKKLYPLLTKEQLESLYTNFDIKAKRKTKPTARASAIRNRIATGLMVFQGLEATALSNLKTEDVDVIGGTLKISSRRTHNERKLGLQAVQIIELDRYINQTRKELQEEFKHNTDQLLVTGYSHYRDAHKRLMQRLRKDHPYLQSTQQIRASVITYWLKQYNLREVQYMAGHRKIQSTESYQRNDTEGLQLDIDRFHPMNEIEI